MKKLIASGFAAIIAIVGLWSVSGGGTAQAASPSATCSTSYTSPTCGPTSTGNANPNAVPACAASVSGGKGTGTLSITSSLGVSGGLLQAKLHRVHTPGKAKIKVTVTSYNGPITKKLTKGTWHGTLIYVPQQGAPVGYCGIVFYNLKVK